MRRYLVLSLLAVFLSGCFWQRKEERAPKPVSEPVQQVVNQTEPIPTEHTDDMSLGSESWSLIGNDEASHTNSKVRYLQTPVFERDKYYLVGDWQMKDNERQVLLSDSGEIQIQFLGSRIDVELGLEDAADTAKVYSTVDSKHHKTFFVDGRSRYTVFEGEYGEHLARIRIRSKGVAAYGMSFE